MDASEFTADAPDTLVRIPEGVAFVPHAVPPEIAITKNLLIAAENARGALGEFVGQSRLVQNINL